MRAMEQSKQTVASNGLFMLYEFLPLVLLGLNSCGWPGVVGTYHVAGPKDATNLVIRLDGSFTFDASSCDSSTVISGTYHVIESGVVLTARNGGVFEFPVGAIRAGESGALRAQVSVVRVVPHAEGGIITTADGASLLWQPGRTCSICEGSPEQHSIGTQPCSCESTHFNVPGVEKCD